MRLSGWSGGDAAAGDEELLVEFAGRGSGRLLVLPPFFDEHNKFRRQTALIARQLQDFGWTVLVPDLPGCNESPRDHAHQTLERWAASAAAAAHETGATHTLGIRSGGWVQPAHLPGWSYAVPRSDSVLRALLRAHAVSAKEAGRAENTAQLLARARQEGLESGGWQLGAALVRELADGALPAGGEHTLALPHEAVGGPALWLRAEPGEDAGQAARLAALIGAGPLP